MNYLYIILIIIAAAAFIMRRKESFYIQSWRPQELSDINSGAPLEAAYNDTVFDNSACLGQPGVGYIL